MRPEPEGIAVLVRWFALLVRLFPGSFRAVFGDELENVFVRRLVAARQRGWAAVLRLCLREYLGLSVAIFVEWWALWWRKKNDMSETNATPVERHPWRGALLAALPYLLVALVALPVWALVPRLSPAARNLVSIVEVVLIPALALALGVAWRRGWPRWSGSWAGYAVAIAFIFLLDLQATFAGLWLPYTVLWLLWIAGLLGGLLLLARRDPFAGLLTITSFLPVIFAYITIDVTAPAVLVFLALLAAIVAGLIYRAHQLSFAVALVLIHNLVVAPPAAYLSLVHHAYLPPYNGQLTTTDALMSILRSIIGSLVWLLPPLLLVLRQGRGGRAQRQATG